MSLWVIVGGQFGSEGKGKVSAHITKREGIDICVRCGGPNSGHSFVDESGNQVVLRQLPTGFVNLKTRLLIPAGALIDPLVLRNEIDALQISPERIGIDPNSFIIEERDRQAERSLQLRERLSSTLCGVGSAVSRRALRGEDSLLARDAARTDPWLEPLISKEGVSAEVNEALDRGKKVLIEGTQGFGLSLYHSQHYPHCTSRDTTAAGFLSEVGVSPRWVTEIVVVFRTFPIRVAGDQAGPLEKEITWEQLRQESGYPHHIEERTSVTKAVRRVARFDWNLAVKAVRVNGPTRLALNGLDYLDYGNLRQRKVERLSACTTGFLAEIEDKTQVPLGYLGVGQSLADVIEAGSRESFRPNLRQVAMR